MGHRPPQSCHKQLCILLPKPDVAKKLINIVEWVGGNNSFILQSSAKLGTQFFLLLPKKNTVSAVAENEQMRLFKSKTT